MVQKQTKCSLDKILRGYIQLYPITRGTWIDSDIQNNPDIGDGEEGEQKSPHKKQ